MSCDMDGNGDGFDDQASDEVEKNAFSDTRHADVREGLRTTGAVGYKRRGWLCSLCAFRAFHSLCLYKYSCSIR